MNGAAAAMLYDLREGIVLRVVRSAWRAVDIGLDDPRVQLASEGSRDMLFDEIMVE